MCIIKCLIEDPSSENKNHRLHREGGTRCLAKNNFPCSICGENVKSSKEIEEHLGTPDDSYIYTGSFECPSCDKKYTFPSELQEHIETSHDQSWSSFTLLPNASSTWKYVPCKVCDMRFKNEDDVNFHMCRVEFMSMARSVLYIPVKSVDVGGKITFHSTII